MNTPIYDISLGLIYSSFCSALWSHAFCRDHMNEMVDMCWRSHSLCADSTAVEVSLEVSLECRRLLKRPYWQAERRARIFKKSVWEFWPLVK